MNRVHLYDYEIAALKSAIYPGRGSGDLSYPVLGLNGEAGEVAEKWKKVLRDSGGELSEVARDALIKELGDVLWYAAAIAGELHVSLDQVAQLNLQKLAARQSAGTLSGSGDER